VGKFVSIKDQKERILKLAEILKLIHLYAQQGRRFFIQSEIME